MASEVNFNLGEAGGSDRNMEKLVASAASIADAQAIQASIERRLASPAAQLTTGFVRTAEVTNKFVDPSTGAAFKLTSCQLVEEGAEGSGAPPLVRFLLTADGISIPQTRHELGIVVESGARREEETLRQGEVDPG